MTKPKTLREWMSDQQAPPEIQAKMQELFRLSEIWRKELHVPGTIIYPDEYIRALDDILGKENT
jgi:hypothetical protein